MHCLAIGLLNELDEISTCIAYNKYVTSEVQDRLRDSGIIIAELLNSDNRLDSTNRRVQQSKALMMNSEQKLPNPNWAKNSFRCTEFMI